MNVILQRLDDAMLSIAQKISDIVDDALGLDHWSIAVGMLHAGVGFVMISTALAVTMAHDFIGYLITAALSFIWFIMYQGLLATLRRQRASRDAGRALRVSERETRIVDLVLMGFVAAVQIPSFDVSSAFFVAAIACFHFHYYFKAADLPPPSTSSKVAWSG